MVSVFAGGEGHPWIAMQPVESAAAVSGAELMTGLAAGALSVVRFAPGYLSSWQDHHHGHRWNQEDPKSRPSSHLTEDWNWTTSQGGPEGRNQHQSELQDPRFPHQLLPRERVALGQAQLTATQTPKSRAVVVCAWSTWWRTSLALASQNDMTCVMLTTSLS